MYENEIELVEHALFKYPRTDEFLQAWQTLKTAMLAQQTKNKIKPCNNKECSQYQAPLAEYSGCHYYFKEDLPDICSDYRA